MQLVTTIQSVERRPDGTHLVEVLLDDDALIPRKVQVIRARGRAMVSVGVIDVATDLPADVARAIRELSLDRIKRRTEIIDDSGNIVTIRVQ